MSVLSIDEAIAQGMGRSANTGGFSTGKVGGGAGNVMLIDEPELIIGVPPGYCIRPFYIAVQIQGGAIGTDADENECLIAVDSLGYWRNDGTATPVAPSNLRTDIDKGSACNVGAAVTGAITTTPGYAVIAAAAPVLDLELGREVMQIDVATNAGNTDVAINYVYQPKHPIFIAGPATLLVYFGGTVATVGGFIQAQWIEGLTKDLLPPRGLVPSSN